MIDAARCSPAGGQRDRAVRAVRHEPLRGELLHHLGHARRREPQLGGQLRRRDAIVLPLGVVVDRLQVVVDGGGGHAFRVPAGLGLAAQAPVSTSHSSIAVERDEEDGCRDPGRRRQQRGCGTRRASRCCAVSATSGMSANGMPNDSTTWLSTRASVGSTPIAEDDQRRDQRDQPAGEERHAHVQQAVHDLGAGVGADRGRGEAAREQADREQRRDDRVRCPTLSAAYAPSSVSVPGDARRGWRRRAAGCRGSRCRRSASRS